MGEAKRRQTEIEKLQQQVKLTPRQQQATLSLVHVNRLENQNESGMVFAVNVFAVVFTNPKTGEILSQLAEETPDGSQPVFIQSVPQPVGRRVIATPSPSPILARG